MSYTVRLTRQANRQKEKLPEKVKTALLFLLHEIARNGPVRGDWPNYGKLGSKRAVWEEIGGEIRLVELTYVGTHEKAPY